MRQAGIIAAGALHALEQHRDRLVEDHDNAQRLREGCEACSPLSIRGNRVDTNIVICEVDEDWANADKLATALEEQGVKCFAIGPQAIRFVTHLDVDATQIESACKIIQRITNTPAANLT